MWRERRLRFGPRVTLPLLFSSLFLFQSGSDRKDIRSSRRCGNVCKRPCLRSYGKRCLRAVGKPTAFPSGRECLFSIGGAAVFHISIALRASLFDKGLGLSQQAIFRFKGRGPPKSKIRQWVLIGCACYRNPTLVFPLLLILQIQLVRMACPLSNILLLTSEYTCAILITALPISLLSKGVIECRCRIGELIPRYLKVQKKNLWKRGLQMPPCGKYAKKPA